MEDILNKTVPSKESSGSTLLEVLLSYHHACQCVGPVGLKLTRKLIVTVTTHTVLLSATTNTRYFH